MKTWQQILMAIPFAILIAFSCAWVIENIPEPKPAPYTESKEETFRKNAEFQADIIIERLRKENI